MTAKSSIESNQTKRSHPLLRMLASGGIRILIAAIILGGAGAAYQYQMKTSPRAGRQKPPTQARLVQVMSIQRDNRVTTVTQMGPVIPAQQVTLRPQVTGQIVEISPDVVPGAFVEAGQRLFVIDPRDYEIAVHQRQSEVVRALRDLKIEQGNQAVAQREYELLGEEIPEEDQELVLRGPQLASAEAAYESAKAALERAELDLARCTITAPFNAIVQEKSVDLGTTVSASSNLVTLIGTDEAWVRVKIPLHEIKWITIPQSNGDLGSEVTIRNPMAWAPGQCRTGRVLRLMGELEPQGLLTQVLVGVKDPFSREPENRGQPQVLMGSLVSAQIQGQTLESVFPIERPYLRDNDTVWIMDSADELEIRPVQIAFRGPTHVYVTDGLAENERLVTTDIAAPVAGMPLRVAQADNRGDQPASATVVQGGY
jgi:RND family efflux transporter MFP subunit